MTFKKDPVEAVSLFVYLASSKKKETWPGQERLKCVEGSLRGAKNTQQSSEARVPQIRKKWKQKQNWLKKGFGLSPKQTLIIIILFSIIYHTL